MYIVNTKNSVQQILIYINVLNLKILNMNFCRRKNTLFDRYKLIIGIVIISPDIRPEINRVNNYSQQNDGHDNKYHNHQKFS